MRQRLLNALRASFRRLQASRLGPLLRMLPVERVRHRALAWPAGAVVDTVQALDDVGASTWIGGGWGVDALVGRQTRRHADLDLFFVGDGEPLCRALADIGFELYRERYERGKLVRIAEARDRSGRTIDVVTTRDQALLTGDALTSGLVGGRRVPCLSAAMQLALHRGYAPERSDRHDVRVLCRALGVPVPPEYVGRAKSTATALVVPVPEADGVIARHRARFDPVARRGLPAHVTALYPFAPEACVDHATEEAIESVLADIPAFRFSLARVDTFPNVLYLAPEPSDGFHRLIDALAKRWPEYPPYSGAHAEVVPHLTIAHGVTPPDLEAEIESVLPVEAEAREVWLMTEGRRGQWIARRRFSLAPPPAPEHDAALRTTPT